MASITEFAGSTTIGATEYSLTNNSTTLASQVIDGIVQGWIDFSNLSGSDLYVFRVYEKVRSSSSQGVAYEGYASAGSGRVTLPSLMLKHGWDVTVQKITGTDRSIEWSVRYV